MFPSYPLQWLRFLLRSAKREEFMCLIFSWRSSSPFGIRFTSGSAQVRNSVSEGLKKIIIFFRLYSFSPHMVGAKFFAVFLILMRSRSPASFLRNFQTVLTCPAKPCTVIFAYLSSQILYHPPLLHSLYSSNSDVSLPQKCQVCPIPRAFAHAVCSA